MNSSLTGILDLDAMLHIVASVQYRSGNRDNPVKVAQHVERFVSNICTNATKGDVVMFYQKEGHTNFRNTILPEYKGHRTISDAVKLWKPTIHEAYKHLGAFGLDHIESDDAQSLIAEELGYRNSLIITSDKDMIQVPCTIYNPYKTGIKYEDRWTYQNRAGASRFLWKQVLTGDPTDMPGELCGIQGVGDKTADKILASHSNPGVAVQIAYNEKYGKEDAFIRCNTTYKMVKLLDKASLTYINPEAQAEVEKVLKTFRSYFTRPVLDAETLFTTPVRDEKKDINTLFDKL